jgi:hypothetical protein
MDNKAYLDEIAVKGKKKFSAGPILTPVMLKLIIVGVFAVIAMIVVGTMLSSNNDGSAATHEAVYFRMTGLLDKKGAINTYIKKVKASELRSYTSSLIASLTTSTSEIKGAASRIGLNTSSASADVSSQNSLILNQYLMELDDAYLTGTLDATYASSTAYQLSILIGLEQSARMKTSDGPYATTLDNSIRDLTALEESFRNYADTH